MALMIHRTTLIAIPIVGLVVLSASVGWWGLEQNRQKQDLVQLASNQYRDAFHGLISDVNNLNEEVDKATVASDTASFQTQARQIWRLSYAAQNEIARLPAGLMQTNHIQAFLATVSANANEWMKSSANPRKPSVQRQIATLSKETQAVSDKLSSLQPLAFTANVNRLALLHANQPTKQDNQMADGVKKVDGVAAGFVETISNSPTGSVKPQLNEPNVTDVQALARLRQFVGVSPKSTWQIHRTNTTRLAPSYVVQGQSSSGSLLALVTRPGAHVVSFHIDYAPQHSSLDLSTSRTRAIQWLSQRGFHGISIIDAHEIGNVGYLTAVPTRHNLPVLGRFIYLAMAMDNGRVISFDASDYYANPVSSVPERRYTAQQLEKKLNPTFHARMAEPAIELNESRKAIPVVIFYGLANEKTYRIDMDATNGQEVRVERLS